MLTTRTVYELDDWISIPGRGNNETFSLFHCVQIGSGGHAASYQMDSRDAFHGNKATGT
jgi:hypothetical protein